ncbi:MAG: Electron transport complex protein RnfC [Deltaproteobacteria bacterium ADurb.Bin510]|nr:MAG: Electron transport complex protein RnfC [Deltaproteobacteria bacterium ADurb.Bin510]
MIEADGQDEWYEGLPLKRDPLSMEPVELLDCIKSAGIVGMGGATFPTHVKLSPPKDKKIDLFVVNGAECEPFLTADYRLMLEESERIFGGVKIVMKILGLNEAVIAIEDNKPEALKALRAKAPAGVKIEYVKTKYPQGAEKQLIYAVSGREVPSGGLPMDAGALVQNTGTVAAIWDACATGAPLIERITTVTGRGIAEPKNIRVRVGTPLEKVVEFCGGLKDAGKIISGGPMMGFALGGLNSVIMKGTSGLTILSQDEVNKSAMSNCIACGRCVDACPMGLVPSTFSKLGERNLFERAMNENLMDCFECGCCTYVCPAHRPIVQYVKHLKALGREASAKKGA